MLQPPLNAELFPRFVLHHWLAIFYQYDFYKTCNFPFKFKGNYGKKKRSYKLHCWSFLLPLSIFKEGLKLMKKISKIIFH